VTERNCGATNPWHPPSEYRRISLSSNVEQHRQEAAEHELHSTLPDLLSFRLPRSAGHPASLVELFAQVLGELLKGVL
jgi:hypothetical protein